MEKITKLILDYSTWYCGDGKRNLGKGLGLGDVYLLNGQGFSCCIGQWSLQQGVSKMELLDVGEPSDLRTSCEPFNELSDTTNFRNTILSKDCIEINDDTETTIDKKIELLTERLNREGIELIVINKP